MEIYESIFRVIHNGTVVLDYGVALDRTGIVLDGGHVVEPVHFARAAGLTHIVRGGESHTLEWTVVEPEPTPGAAVKAAMNHAATAPKTVAQVVVELETGEQWRLDDAVVESWSADSSVAEGLVAARSYRVVGGVLVMTQDGNAGGSGGSSGGGSTVWEQLSTRWKDL